MSRIAEALKRAQSQVAEERPDGQNPESLARFPSRAAVRVREADVSPAPVPQAPGEVDFILNAKTPASQARTAAETVEAHAPGLFSRVGPLYGEKLVVSEGAAPPCVEQYRRVAAALHHAQTDRGIKVVMIASALPGEGKTLTATNLALTLSESYRRKVLLIDADLRKPTLHEVFQVPNLTGLNDGLTSETDHKLTIVEVSPRLSLLPAGKPDPDPMSGLTSDRMERLLREACERFDWVILDTPPVGLLPDANLLAAMVDAAILVVGAGRTPCALVQKSVEAIGRDRVVGVVLNRVANGALPRSAYDGYYYGQAPRRRGAGALLGGS